MSTTNRWSHYATTEEIGRQRTESELLAAASAIGARSPELLKEFPGGCSIEGLHYARYGGSERAVDEVNALCRYLVGMPLPKQGENYPPNPSLRYADRVLRGLVVQVFADVENVRGDDRFRVRVVHPATVGQWWTVATFVGREQAQEFRATLPIVSRGIIDDLFARLDDDWFFGHRLVRSRPVEVQWEDLIISRWARLP